MLPTSPPPLLSVTPMKVQSDRHGAKVLDLDESGCCEEKWTVSSDARPWSSDEAVDVIVLPTKGPDFFPFSRRGQ